MKVVYSVLFILLLTACGADYGHQIKGDNFTVFFTSADDQEMAEKVALYWKENDMLTGDQQDIQLMRYEDWLEVRLIAANPQAVTPMPFAERKTLLDLQKELQNELGVANLQIVICNGKFEPIYNINE